MSVRRLYTVTIPENALQQRSGQAQQRQELAKLTGLSGDGSVIQVGSNPGEFDVEGQFRGTDAEMMAAEVSELAGSDAISSVAFYDPDTDVAAAGYYTVERIQNRRFRPQRPEVASFQIRLAREGTRDSHLRYIRTNNRDVTHDFGSDATERINIPNTATKVRWIAEDKSATTPATSVGTTAAEFGTIAQYDPTNAPAAYDSPGIVYQLPYSDSGNVDAAVFDTRGLSEFVNGDFKWQQVFQSSHEFSGSVVLENGVVRLTIDESTNSLTAEEWDSGTSAWVSRSLGVTGGWQVIDVDVIDANPARVYAQLEFEDTDDSSRYSLDAFLHWGWSNVQFAVPVSLSGPIPSDLVTYLDPVASPRYVDARETKQIIDREVVRK